MLTDAALEQHLVALKTPSAGRALVRQIRELSPVRDLQERMDGVRTRFISRKMERALYAESRTCEFPAIFLREYDPQTLELWPQPCQLDLFVHGLKQKTRVQHTPDLFLICESELVIEEWRTEERLRLLAQKRPQHFYKDETGRWHYIPAEEYLEPLGITYRLRSADEHPRDFISNLHFLEDYTQEVAPPVPEQELKRLRALLSEHRKLRHLDLVEQHAFKADHIFQAILSKDVFVDLTATALRHTDELVIYKNELVARADYLLTRESRQESTSCGIDLAVGSRFDYDGVTLEIVMPGTTEVIVRTPDGKTSRLSFSLVKELFETQLLTPQSPISRATELASASLDSIMSEKGLEVAVTKLLAVRDPSSSTLSKRTVQRIKKLISGLDTPQEQLRALVPRRIGNTHPKLPREVCDLAQEIIRKHHNTAQAPTTQATFDRYIEACDSKHIIPMSRANFYRFRKGLENTRAREGRRKAYQKAPIPLTFDYGHPVHGVLPHEVCYCDHTIMNIFTRGMVIADLGKPTLTIMVDGALSKTRAFYLSYQPPGAHAVLMCLRDYVRRHSRLPRVLVLDNGREFHSEVLLRFCEIFKISIRWRRRSRPRDSSIVERMLGATEAEVLQQLKGNSVALKDPREVSSSHQPRKHITWTLPALHGALDNFLMVTHASRIHPRFGVSANEMEKQLNLQMGARDHLLVRNDALFRLLTAIEGTPSTRVVDPIRGVMVDGVYHWSDRFKGLKRGTTVKVRLEAWNAQIVYVELNGEWIHAVSRDSGVLHGRYRYEFATVIREESRKRKSLAQKDKSNLVNVRSRLLSWSPEHWDPRLREQMVETYRIYKPLGITEAIEVATNEDGHELSLRLPRDSRMGIDLDSIEQDAQAQTDGVTSVGALGGKRTADKKDPFKTGSHDDFDTDFDESGESDYF
jgi:putative transposase